MTFFEQSVFFGVSVSLVSYGLGVLLHELLLGLRPCGQPTRRPSSRVNEITDAAVPPSARLRLRRAL